MGVKSANQTHELPRNRGISPSPWGKKYLDPFSTHSISRAYEQRPGLLPSAPGAGGLHRRLGFFSWGALLLREVDRRLGLTERVARRLGDPRQRGKVRHEAVTMVRQRVHAVALGY